MGPPLQVHPLAVGPLLSPSNYYDPTGDMFSIGRFPRLDEHDRKVLHNYPITNAHGRRLSQVKSFEEAHRLHEPFSTLSGMPFVATTRSALSPNGRKQLALGLVSPMEMMIPTQFRNAVVSPILRRALQKPVYPIIKNRGAALTVQTSFSPGNQVPQRLGPAYVANHERLVAYQPPLQASNSTDPRRLPVSKGQINMKTGDKQAGPPKKLQKIPPCNNRHDNRRGWVISIFGSLFGPMRPGIRGKAQQTILS